MALIERSILGGIAPDRITAITRTIVREYFDQTIGGHRSALLDGTAPLPEVTVHRPGQP